MRLYLAGPMSGLPDFNFPAFIDAARKLREQGHDVFNPAEEDIKRDGFDPRHDEPKPFIHYMRHDLPAVLSCDGVATLPGWESSKGARLEVHVARECGLKIFDAATMREI